MDFLETISVTFKEITPSYSGSDKWKEVMLNTGGTHSTLQDIKLPSKAGGYWYKPSIKSNTRNRLIYWQTTPDAFEISEGSLDVNLSMSNLRCKVAPGTPPLNGITVWERPESGNVIILVATVSSVHRLVFPHPETLDKKATFGISGTSPSILFDTSSINNPQNYHILSQYSTTSTGIAHTCASYLKDNGEAVFALSFGYGGDSGILLVKLPATGQPVAYQLKKESTVPRFLSGITGALRGKGPSVGLESLGVVVSSAWVVSVSGDACLRAWPVDDAGSNPVLSQPLAHDPVKAKPPPHGHMLQKATDIDGNVILVAYLSFPEESVFVVLRMQDGGPNNVRFSIVSRIFGPQLDLLDYSIGYGDGQNIIWALWSQPDGETAVTCTSTGVEAQWSAVATRTSPVSLPHLSSHEQYKERLMALGLFPASVIQKALVIYRRTWGGAESGSSSDLGESALSAVQARIRHLTARANSADHQHLMHKCWSDLYSWCIQYMEGLQKPLGLMVSSHCSETDSGWWCAVIRRKGISLVRELEPLEKMMLSPDATVNEPDGLVQLVRLAGWWANRVGDKGESSLLHSTLHNRTTHALKPLITPQQIDEISAIIEPIKDLQAAMLELNNALRLDVPDIEITKEDETGEFSNLFSSELGVAIVTEAIRQMAEIRCRTLSSVVLSLGAAESLAPGTSHCHVHWQAYRAVLWLATAKRPMLSKSEELFRLKLNALGLSCSTNHNVDQLGVISSYVHSQGLANRARVGKLLAEHGHTEHWHYVLPLLVVHVAHQLWAVSGGFEFGQWLSTINRPQLVQSYVNMLEPWCEWNACSRQFILGLALLDMEDLEGAYSAFCKAAKGVTTEPFLRSLVEATGTPETTHQSLVLYYMKVIKLFEIHDAGNCVVKLAETAISIADKNDPNLPMFQWVVFKWHLSCGRVSGALSSACSAMAPHARHAAAATLLNTLASRKQLHQLVTCSALSSECEKEASARAKLHDATGDNPYYDFLYALYIHRQHYRKAASVQYERAARVRCEGLSSETVVRLLASALVALRLATPTHAFLLTNNSRVIGPEELAAELREEMPDSLDVVQQSLIDNETIDFNALYPHLKEATKDTLLNVTMRALSTGQTFPCWFLQRYMEVDSNSCIRALLAGGRAVEAANVCSESLKYCLRRMTSTTGSSYRSAPLAVTDLILLELKDHTDVECVKAYEDLQAIVKEYMGVVVRTSEDVKLAHFQYSTA